MSDDQQKSPDPVDIAVGANIRARRQVLMISQQALGEAIGLTFQQVQKYERGSNRVSASKLLAIADALECHPGDLFTGVAPAYDEDAANRSPSWLDNARTVNDRAPGLIDKLAQIPRNTLADLCRVANAILQPAATALVAIGNDNPAHDCAGAA